MEMKSETTQSNLILKNKGNAFIFLLFLDYSYMVLKLWEL